MKKLIIALVIVFLFSPLASALPCSETSHEDLCEEVMDSDIGDDEKHWLVTELMQDWKNFPNHEFVREWNTAVDTSLPPEGITKHSKGFIKEAWLKLLAVIPSTLENNTLYVNDSGELLSAYNHRIEIPPDYSSPGYPRTRNGDCATYYRVKHYSSGFDAFRNSAYLGSDHLVSYTCEEDSEFKGQYDVLLKTDISHWKWRKYCCRWYKGSCKKYCHRCEYHHTQHKTDSVTVKDKLKAKHFKENMSASFELIDQYSNTSKGILEASNFSSLHLDFKDANFTEYNHVYTLNRSIPPHNILTVKSEELNRKKARNLNVRGNKTYTVVLKDADNCSIRLYSHFSSKEVPCNLIGIEDDPVIETDKLSYYPDETIIASIMPDREYNLTYAGRNYTARDEVRLNAEYSHNRISIWHKGKEISRIIHVKDKEQWNLLFGISMFGSLNYILIGIIRKTWGALL